MNVHLVRSKEVSEDLYWDVVELLQQFNGPAKYIASESYTDYENMKIQKEIIEDKKSLSNAYPFEREFATWEQLFNTCQEYRITHDLGIDEYVILLTDIANDKNWFMMMAPNKKDGFIHTDDWDYYVDTSPKYPIAYEVVELLLHSHMFDNLQELLHLSHQHPVGCISDMVGNKKDITLKLRTADICPACQKIIRAKKVPSPLVNQVLNTIEGIRKQMLFKERFRYHLTPSRMRFNLVHRKAIMTDIQDMKISLTPLEATIYYFFLRHPEGIILNRLQDHEEELYRIYSKCSVANSDNNIAAMRNSIRALTDPLENSLNEKTSRIKSKFTRALGPELATHYYIAKERNETAYKIKIDRELVNYDQEII